ncbi:MAG: hypothetical protein UX47_C0005G0058 [Candidatus Collierbacteria bacterium GW2011_GWA2_46_26]|uniref:Uncharacterized protein n=1 Tax=Candidatus Collierbacteria bacterium GW2011_GWA2_46_26 TaxID=1618381 RepID=A0A0G1PKK0_9BACT|nr:MAG: hypothetical protein UW29_C0008G0058 [Candidatus Collierbacteria bacterium GW2011_GWC2_44_13]KKU33256.1 MAG: hypothetical protein UX47_C0005G0058 [Candidatus Collierbacteria bacterium GW2011_GWA2_46_26]
MKNLKSQPKNAIIKLHRVLEQAIKAKCYDCQCGQKKLDCEIIACPLYLLRPWANKKYRKNKQISQG